MKLLRCILFYEMINQKKDNSVSRCFPYVNTLYALHYRAPSRHGYFHGSWLRGRRDPFVIYYGHGFARYAMATATPTNNENCHCRGKRLWVGVYRSLNRAVKTDKSFLHRHSISTECIPRVIISRLADDSFFEEFAVRLLLRIIS